MVLCAAGMVGLGTAAVAAVPGIDIGLLHNGEVVSDDSTIPEGADLQLRVQYNPAEGIDGEVITITVPDGIDVPTALPTNNAIESISQDGDTITVTFKDPVPSDISEGAFVINLKAGQVDGDTSATISWEVGNDRGRVTIIVEDEVIPPSEVENTYAKSVNPSNLDSFVIRGEAEEGYPFVGLDPAIEDAVLTYTLVMTSAEARSGYLIEDTLADGLGFISDSFEATLTTSGDPEPFDFNPAVTGNSFAGRVDVPEQSTLRITYQVEVTDRAALEARLQNAYDARNGATGNYEIRIPNDASFGEDADRSANVRIRGNVPGVGIGENFAKSGNWSLRNVIAEEDGTLTDPPQMTYTLRANLTPWDDRNSSFTLQQNVVISDALISQAEWLSDDEDFIAISGEGPISSLTLAAGFEGTATEFAADDYVGQYALVGNTLLINVGKHNTTDVSITVKAQLNTVEGLTGSGETSVIDGTYYPWNNRAQFHYGASSPVNRDHNAGVVTLPDDRDGGINDHQIFNKTGPSGDVRVNPGDTAEVPYRFTINTGAENIDPLTARIVDDVNTEIFDITNLDETVAVSGNYGGTNLTAEHFAVSVDADENIVIELSEAGKTLVDGLTEDQWWTIDVTLTTVPFDGKETFEVYNRATLFGSGDNPDYWSDDESEATSYGDEAELRKRVHDENLLDWVPSRDAILKDGELVNDTFVYYIELIPRGNYGSAFPVTIFTREDVLPDSVEFLGFVTVDGEEVPDLDSASTDPVNMPGNVRASYADGVVTIQQIPGTSLNPNQGRIVTYFAVTAVDASQPIVNQIAGSETTITPVGDPSIDIEKWNDEGEAPEYDESGALLNDGYDGDFDSAPGKALEADAALPINFTISNDGREDLVDVVVSDELTDGSGEIQDLVCEFPDGSTGTEWDGPFAIGTQFDCIGTLPALTNGQTHSNLSQVTGVGIVSDIEVDDEDEWNGYVPDPSVDIEKWNVETEGVGPEYDGSGALLNDGYDGDFDSAPGKLLVPGESHAINFTISNDGEEALRDIVVSDELTDGSGEIQDLVCEFPDGSTGTEWDGPFAVGTQFDCTGTLPGLENGDIHENTASVVGVGIESGTEVDDEDEWNGYVPDPSIDIEKWNDEGEAPEYDESGALLNDGYAGDFDESSKSLPAGQPLPINFTVSNDGDEDLVDVVVSDELTDGVGSIEDLVCTFPDGTTGTSWDGPFEVSTQFECAGTLPALAAGDTHSNLSKVTGVGIDSGIEVDDEDPWSGHVKVPGIDIEKWNDEGEAPEYDESGALLNDGFAGDFDFGKGKLLVAGESQEINFTVSNDGTEALKDLVVSDELTDGVGSIEDLVCTFPDGSTGTSWDGPFEVGTQFECSGVLPGLPSGVSHSNTASVFGVGIESGNDVSDEDEWNGYVPDPSVDIEKWNDEGEAPEYDESGALLNDGYAGDFDESSKLLTAGTETQINFTVSNDGDEDLVDVVVSDELTDGVGSIEGLVCTFPDGSEGTEWAGPFEVGVQFDCVGTLPALNAGEYHADLATVTGIGIDSGIVVDDDDPWSGEVPVPSIGVEKWNDEGEAPEYDETGLLLNDGYRGDHDSGPGAQLTAGEDEQINFTITNDGQEPLVDITVRDELTDGSGEIQDLVCTFPDGSTGTEWGGPFAVGAQFDCTGTLPGLNAGESHANQVTVNGVGLFSGISVDGDDEWHGSVPDEATTPSTGIDGAGVLATIAGLLLLGGGGALLYNRRRTADV